jgi:hypothetical protein
MGIQCFTVYRDSIHRLCIGLRSLFNFNGGMMNPAREEGNRKIIRIVSNEMIRWGKMSKEDLICELINEKWHFLETELEYGNEEYLDELLEEIV